MENIEIKRGEIFWVNQEFSSENQIQSKTRPYIIISNNLANKNSNVITAIPLTSNLNKKKMPTHCEITIKNIYYNTEKKNIALCEQITCIDKNKITSFVGKLSEEELKCVEKCVKIQIGLLEVSAAYEIQ